jgi:hypothetical protein
MFTSAASGAPARWQVLLVAVIPVMIYNVRSLKDPGDRP